MESYNNKMKGYIKEILSENPFYDRTAIKDEFKHDICESNFTEKLDLAKIFNHDTYAEEFVKYFKGIRTFMYYT